MSKGQTYLLSLSVLLVFLLPGSALPHGGGLDANGCHHDRKRGGYHCHRSPSIGQAASWREPVQSSQPTGLSTGDPIAVSFSIGASTPQTEEQCAVIVKQQDRAEIIDHIFERRENRITMEVDGSLQESIGKPSPIFITARSLCADLAALGIAPAIYQKEIEQRTQAKKQREKQREEQAGYEARVRDWQDRARQGQAREAREARMAAHQRAEPKRLQEEARDNGRKVTASQYGDQWPFTITSGELECLNKAVIMHTPSGTYNINGKAMSRYEKTYKSPSRKFLK
jgi:hypothetical protein